MILDRSGLLRKRMFQIVAIGVVQIGQRQQRRRYPAEVGVDTTTFRRIFPGTRTVIQRRAALAALNEVRLALLTGTGG